MADKKQNFITHKGTAQYPWLNKADTQFDSDGVFKTNLLVPQDQAKDLVDQLTQIAKDEFGSKASGARMPYKVDEETGMMSIISKSKFQPKFFDSKGQVVTNPPPLYGGSIIKIGGVISPYTVTGNNGISLRLTKVQIIEPVSQVGADTDGFEAEDDGFVAEEDSFEDPTPPLVTESEDGAASYNF
tara:strand:+ start:427 stop:984 length:558 start_codon:yes stop_codon:yes gene_type:complete